MGNEEWRSVPDFEGLYEVSDRGRVRSLRSGRLLKQGRVGKYGHRQILLSPGCGLKAKAMYVHRLVLLAFVGLPPGGLQACHNDGNAGNNCLDNLRWDTQSSNMHDRVKHGTHHHTNRTHCPKGHLLDGVRYNKNGTVRQRRCMTCNRALGRARQARKKTCPQGHPFDGVRYKADGTVRQRYCTICAHAALERGRVTRWGATNV